MRIVFPWVLVAALATGAGCLHGTGGGLRSADRSPVTVPGLVPPDASVVAFADSSSRFIDLIDDLDALFGPPDAAATKALKEDLVRFLAERTGLRLDGVSSAVFFVQQSKKGALVVTGVAGTLAGTPAGTHGDVLLVAIAKDVVAAQHGNRLILGDPEAVAAVLDVAAGKAPSLAKGNAALAELVRHEGEGAAFLIAADVAAFPATELRAMAAPFGIKHAVVRFDGKTARAMVSGEAGGLARLADIVRGGLAEMVTGAASAKSEAIKGEVAVGVGGIMGEHMAKRLARALQPKVVGDRLVIEAPLDLHNYAGMLPVTGALAAVAIPAFTKYVERSKAAGTTDAVEVPAVERAPTDAAETP